MDKLKLIQCGVGGMGKSWWNGPTRESPDFDLVAIVDVNDAALNEAGDALNIPVKQRFKDLKRAIRKVQAHAVLTVTPPVVHAKHAKIAFENGLHLLTEKPLADTLKNAQRMVKQAQDAGKQLVVAQNYRFKPPMATLRRLMAEKPLGDFGHGHIDFYIGADFTGSFRETMEYPLLVDMAIHHLDLIRAVTGKNIARMTAQSFRPSWSWYMHEPGLNLLMELEDGTPFSYSGDWSALGKQTGWNGNWRLQCAQGSIVCEKDAITLWRSEKWGKEEKSEPVANDAGDANQQARLLTDFAKAIRTGTPAETSGADNLWSFGAVIAGVQSAKKRKSVDVGPLIGN